MILSIIIPIYNAEAYLDECLASVCALRETDMEIICVVDGSPDCSADIVREWQMRDPRVRLIEQENMGQSGARNTGLRESSGEYVYFLDSDDMLTDTRTIPNCIEHMRTERLEILYATADVFFDPPELEGKVVKNERKYFEIGHEYPGVRSGPELLSELHRGEDWCVSVPAKIFRRAHLTENGLSFIVGQTHEDEYFSFCCVFLAKRIAVENVPLFSRRVHPDSIMTRTFGHKRALGNMINMVEILRFLEAHSGERGPDPDIAVTVLNAKRNVSDIYLRMDEKERAAFEEGLRPDQSFYNSVFTEDEMRLKSGIEDLKRQLAEEKRKTAEARASHNKLKRSATYRLARAMTWPFRALRRLLRGPAGRDAV